MKRFIERIASKIQRRDPCYEIYPYYGVGPHIHEGVDLKNPITFIGSTRYLPKEQWPDNYEDTDDGCGMWYCPDKKCGVKNCPGKRREKEARQCRN